MRVAKISTDAPEPTKKLGEVSPGSVIRFPEISFEEALTDDAQAFYLVIGDMKEGRVAIVAIDAKGGIIRRDADRSVVVEDAVLYIRR